MVILSSLKSLNQTMNLPFIFLLPPYYLVIEAGQSFMDLMSGLQPSNIPYWFSKHALNAVFSGFSELFMLALEKKLVFISLHLLLLTDLLSLQYFIPKTHST